MTPTESDQPALGPDGKLLDASKITWYNDPDDSRPIQPTTTTSGEREGEVFKLVPILQRLADSFTSQVNLVSAPAQPVPQLVRDLQTPSPLRNSTSTGRRVVVLSNLVMRKHLLNAGDLPLMSLAVVKPLKETPIRRTRPSQFPFRKARRAQTAMDLKLETMRYVSLGLDFGTN